MPLLTATQHAQLLAHGAQRAHDPAFDPFPLVKLYTPDARAVWLLAGFIKYNFLGRWYTAALGSNTRNAVSQEPKYRQPRDNSVSRTSQVNR